jgi:nitrogenase iron protein NifH
MEHLVITGKSGSGVSTTAVNLSAGLAEQGYRVAHLGYDSRRVSTALLRGRGPLQVACGNACKDPCHDTKYGCAIGFADVLCIECGADGEADVAPDFAVLRRMALVSRYRPDFVVHDIAGDPETVLPLLRHEGEATRLFVLASADFASLTTLNRFLAAVALGGEFPGSFGGVIANNMLGPFSESLVDDFTRVAGTRALVSIPHSLMVSAGEFGGQTVVESAPHSHLSSVYRKLARLVVQHLGAGTPQPLDGASYAAWLTKWSEITEELESGLVRDGAAI